MSDKKNIVLGVTGSIAAHKAVDMCSLLTKGGADVHVVMTKDAQEFVTPLAFKTLSKNPVVTSLYDEEEGWRPAHIHLADKADLLLIAPATANTLAKMAGGMADDALGCIVLALNIDAALIVAPSLNGKMWQHNTSQCVIRHTARHLCKGICSRGSNQQQVRLICQMNMRGSPSFFLVIEARDHRIFGKRLKRQWRDKFLCVLCHHHMHIRTPLGE
jgi:flavoprotein